MSLLTVEDLSVGYHHKGTVVQAVDGVSFTIEPGEVLALVGESGSGKSSIALAMSRLLSSPPAIVSGRVMMNGHDLLRASEEMLRTIRGGTIAYVFQDPATSLNPVLTIGEQLREMLELHTERRGREADAHAVEWLSRVGIPTDQARLGAYPHEFSGGMQQRVMMAMAMMASPKLLIADEPTSALDVTVQLQILRLLRDLQQRLRLSVLLVSHDLTVVERIAHRVVILSSGRVVETGPVTHVLRQPTHPYTKALLSARLPARLRTHG